MKKIILQYTCSLCHLEDRKVEVEPRKPDQDIGDWLNRVATPALVRDHERMSPGCQPKEFAEVKIPMGPEGAEGPIGCLPED